MAVGPLYTTVESVKVRLANKVQFQSGSTPIEGELPNDLLCQLINDAETEVEQDLRSRYMIPFQSVRTGSYADLPDHTKRAIRVAVDLRCVVMILETDFGRGSHINSEGYVKSTADHYEGYVNKLLGQDKEAADKENKRHRFSPPLEDLRLATTNKEADDGYKGMIINTDANIRGAETYAKESINNPAASYVARRLTNPAGG